MIDIQESRVVYHRRTEMLVHLKKLLAGRIKQDWDTFGTVVEFIPGSPQTSTPTGATVEERTESARKQV